MHGFLIIYVHHFLLVYVQIGVLCLLLLYGGCSIGGIFGCFVKRISQMNLKSSG